MKYIVMILSVLLLSASSLGYWYYRDSQKIITILTENNSQLTVAVQTNEDTITKLQEDYSRIDEIRQDLEQEIIQIKRQNQLLVDKFSDSDIELAATVRPELIERLINRGTANALRCFELLSGAELTEKERNATDGKEFNNECPWLYDTIVSR